MHHFDKNDNNYWNESDDFHFFNFNLFLLLISYDFRVIDFNQCPGCVPNFKLAVMAKVRGIFFLIVGNCDEHMHHVDLSDKNYLSDCF